MTAAGVVVALAGLVLTSAGCGEHGQTVAGPTSNVSSADAATASAGSWASAPSSGVVDPPASAPPPAEESAVRADADAASACALPTSPKGVVLRAERHLLPIHADARLEVGEVTVDGKCTPKTECARVDAARMMTLVALVGRASHARHDHRTSPHYGSRTLEVHDGPRSCAVSDSSTSPIDRRDERLFFDAYDAIVGELGKHP